MDTYPPLCERGSGTCLSSLNSNSDSCRPSRYNLWDSNTMELAVSSVLEQGLSVCGYYYVIPVTGDECLKMVLSSIRGLSKEQSDGVVDSTPIRKPDVKETVFCGSGSKQPSIKEGEAKQKEEVNSSHVIAAGLEKKCIVITHGLENAVLGETTNVVLQVESDEDILQLISAGLVGPLVNIVCDVVRLEKRKYQISYTPKARGKYELDIKVNHMPVPGSPFEVAVSLPIEKLGDPQTIKMFKLHNEAKPTGLAINQQGVIIVAEEGSHCISFFTSSGGKLNSFHLQGRNSRGLNHEIKPRGIAVMDDGKILVVDGTNHCVLVFNPDGMFFKPVGKHGMNNLEFNQPMGIAVHPDTKKIFVADHDNHRIQILHRDLTFNIQYGNKGKDHGQFELPRDIAFDTDGNVYVVDCGNHRVQVFSEEMEYIREFGRQGTSEGELLYPSSIHIDGPHVYLTEDGNHRVSIFTTDRGEFVKCFGQYGLSEPGHFNMAHGITIDKNGNVYVSDHYNGRIQVF